MEWGFKSPLAHQQAEPAPVRRRSAKLVTEGSAWRGIGEGLREHKSADDRRCGLDKRVSNQYISIASCGNSSVVEHLVANERVASSNLVSRSKIDRLLAKLVGFVLKNSISFLNSMVV